MNDPVALHGIDPDSRGTIIAVFCLAAVTPAVLLVAPLMVGSMVTQWGYTPQTGGYVITVELLVMALATLPALLWMPRLDWRQVTIGCLLLMIAGNVASAFVREPVALMALRTVTALGGGSIMLICIATLALTREQERNFGWWVVGQLLLGALGLWLLPYVLPHTQLSGFFAILAVLLAALLPAVRYLPRSGRPAETGSPGPLPPARGAQGLAAVFAFYVAVSGVWTYVERIADRDGVAATTIGTILAVSSLFGIAGALTPTWLGARLGRALPLALGFLLVLAGILALAFPQHPVLLLAATATFKYGWTFLLPYLMACMSALDPRGRLVVITNLFIGGGLAAGPLLSALTLGDPPAYGGVVAIGAVGIVLALALSVTLARRLESGA